MNMVTDVNLVWIMLALALVGSLVYGILRAGVDLPPEWDWLLPAAYEATLSVLSGAAVFAVTTNVFAGMLPVLFFGVCAVPALLPRIIARSQRRQQDAMMAMFRPRVSERVWREAGDE